MNAAVCDRNIYKVLAKVTVVKDLSLAIEREEINNGSESFSNKKYKRRSSRLQILLHSLRS
jgi:hypothetical protein